MNSNLNQKRLMASLKVVFLFLFMSVIFEKQSIAQTFKAIYKCEYQNKGVLEEDSMTSNAKFPIPVSISVIYTVFATKEYLEATATEESASSFPGINMSGSSYKIIIDLKNHLVYFPEENKMKRLKLYTLKPDSSGLSTRRFFIDHFDSSYYVITDQSIKKFILPAVVFKNNNGGIKSVNTPNLSINLIGDVQIVNKKMDYENLFRKYLSSSISEYYSFFNEREEKK